ncbi:hypothetical protein IEU95_13725 [Hoyosella rhizosphaerae]|uniref:Uncharacterized protein n=1 Tax=Hoyosella rhizosphaerae TaxID=1755582 RepID=A0A916UFY5_9ACTN|nr:hypothetical protein [Hoyosella rhizosphaerae]MBN4927899.1 hypothetical protein [Hoyosella rhizosphaerae]GGC70840.1 hypothetical protein GCM10011410_24650 [Hoyosella rhizosphaerae]
MRSVRQLSDVPALVWWALGFVIVMLIAAIIGTMNPVREGRVATDFLGVLEGESVDQYRDRVAVSLEDHDDDEALSERWALVKFASPVTADEAAAQFDTVRVSRIALDGGAGVDSPTLDMPDSWVNLPAPVAGKTTREEVLLAGVEQGLSNFRHMRGPVDTATGECACILGAVVRADIPTLRAIMNDDVVAAVEALPEDARWGAFAVRVR